MWPNDTPLCFQAHMGLYCIEPIWLQTLLYGLRHDLLGERPTPVSLNAYADAFAGASFQHFYALSERVERREGALFSQVGDVALIRIVDHMTKTVSKFGGTSTILTRRAIREALASDEITALLMAVDSPGGQVAGTMELAEEVRRASEQKPVVAFYEDLAASAAIWATVFAQRITANANANVGSIGVFAELIDSSGMAEREGIKVHVVSTGPFKGLGASGTPVTPELLDEVQGIVDGIGAQFFRQLQQGRRLSNAKLAAVTTGQVWLASKAVELGLIDGIESFEQALTAAGKMRRRRQPGESAAFSAAIAARSARYTVEE